MNAKILSLLFHDVARGLRKLTLFYFTSLHFSSTTTSHTALFRPPFPAACLRMKQTRPSSREDRRRSTQCSRVIDSVGGPEESTHQAHEQGLFPRFFEEECGLETCHVRESRIGLCPSGKHSASHSGLPKRPRGPLDEAGTVLAVDLALV